MHIVNLLIEERAFEVELLVKNWFAHNPNLVIKDGCFRYVGFPSMLFAAVAFHPRLLLK